MWFNRLLRLDASVSLVVIVVLMTSASARSSAEDYSRNYIMSKHCGSLVDMKDHLLSSVRVQLTDQSVYRPRLSCSFVLRAPPQHRLVVVVEWIDIASGSGPFCTDFLSVWDGEFENRTEYVEGLEVRNCGNEASPSVTSQDQSVTLHFDSNTAEEGAGFSILLTAFHHGECNQGEFRCHNDRCIDDRLKCDDDDNCGDGSDYCVVSLSTAALVIIIVTIVGSIVAVAAVLYCYRESVFGKKKGADSNDVCQPTTESTTASTIPDTNTV